MHYWSILTIFWGQIVFKCWESRVKFRAWKNSALSVIFLISKTNANLHTKKHHCDPPCPGSPVMLFEPILCILNMQMNILLNLNFLSKFCTLPRIALGGCRSSIWFFFQPHIFFHIIFGHRAWWWHQICSTRSFYSRCGLFLFRGHVCFHMESE